MGTPESWRLQARRFAWVTLAIGLVSLDSHAGSTSRRFEFREPRRSSYLFESWPGAEWSGRAGASRLEGWPIPGAGPAVEFGSRVVLGLEGPGRLRELLASTALRLDRVVTSNLLVLEAASAVEAVEGAAWLATQPGVRISHPVRRRPVRLHRPYGPRPNDPYFTGQWHLENRHTNTAAALGFDLNVRAAWPVTRGAGVIVAMGDDGVELRHPDLAVNQAAGLHFNFVTALPNGEPARTWNIHGTAVAGLLAAVGDNRRGVVGVAPQARLASWIVFDNNDELVDEERAAEMFQYRSDTVAVQNHSWGNAGVEQLTLGALENQALDNAVLLGRSGLGVVIVRSSGNERIDGNDGNDDGYAQDPRVIAVGAVRANGQIASYSTPGANVLVAAFSGDEGVDTAEGGRTNYPTLFTTDRQGSLGYTVDVSGGLGDYAHGATGFTGTSGSAPQIAGLCALMLAANPQLTYRDVQQILIWSARQLDPADPDLRRNGAGLAVSHNAGFGVPDAGEAVALARAWRTRPALASHSVRTTSGVAIPDDGLRVLITGSRIPVDMQSIPAAPRDGPHPDEATAVLPMLDVGQALAPIGIDLSQKAALIQRGGNYFAKKLQHAAAAGAAFAVVYNHADATQRLYMNGADIHLLPLPAVFISQTEGERLRDVLQQVPEARAQIRLESLRVPIAVTNTLLCEHVRLRVIASHPRRADVRITLRSPSGTRSILQHYNEDLWSPLDEWDYYTVHHFYESSAGTWEVEVSDERQGAVGRLIELELTVQGVPIRDADRDGLDDDWELAQLGKLDFGPADDPDGDGYSNMREQIQGTHPLVDDRPFRLDFSRWDDRFLRLSWPGLPDRGYHVFRGTDPQALIEHVTNRTGVFPETDWYLPLEAGTQRFFRVRSGD
ncbi:MAG: hypothetical protein FJ387_03005 [Verrucomicrobia bacterium]|nr:hypothetical protein [Verrucomicrobiota bacterium]